VNLDYLPSPDTGLENRDSVVGGYRVDRLNDAELAQWLERAERKLFRWLDEDNRRARR